MDYINEEKENRLLEYEAPLLQDLALGNQNIVAGRSGDEIDDKVDENDENNF